MQSTNQDYMLQFDAAQKAADEIRGCFTEKKQWEKPTTLVNNMIDIASNKYDVEPELIRKELFANEK